MDRDVTHLVILEGCEFRKPIMRECVCGRIFDQLELPLEEAPTKRATCPECHRRFYIQTTVRVFEVVIPRGLPKETLP